MDTMKKELEKRYSQVILDDKDEIIGAYLNEEEQWQLKGEEKYPLILKLAVINYEDKNFYSHLGCGLFSYIKEL